MTFGKRALRALLRSAVFGFLVLACGACQKSDSGALVAVAANFAEVMEQLESEFEADGSHSVTTIVGSTGKLYAQIASGAPFDVLLAADQKRPELLLKAGLAVPGSRFTYAVGRLTLWSPEPDRIGSDGEAILRDGSIRRLAIANPDLAPYGEAARETLEGLGLWHELADHIVVGENIGQTHALVASGNADLGFVALSYVLSPRNQQPGSRWDVPAGLYEPIRQDAVLLTRAGSNPTARAFVDFLRGERARVIVESFGYGSE